MHHTVALCSLKSTELKRKLSPQEPEVNCGQGGVCRECAVCRCTFLIGIIGCAVGVAGSHGVATPVACTSNSRRIMRRPRAWDPTPKEAAPHGPPCKPHTHTHYTRWCALPGAGLRPPFVRLTEVRRGTGVTVEASHHRVLHETTALPPTWAAVNYHTVPSPHRAVRGWVLHRCSLALHRRRCTGAVHGSTPHSPSFVEEAVALTLQCARS